MIYREIGAPDTNGNTQYATNAEKVMVSQCLERSCGMEEKKILGGRGGGWKEKGHNIQMADWDLAS